MGKVAVVALGGNALARSGQAGTFAEQSENATAMVEAICGMREAGWRVVLVHGNGPQVGNLAVQQAEGAGRVPEMPLFQLGAMTQGQLGSLLDLALRRACKDHIPGVVSLVTHVVVDPADPAFDRPSKPIGPFLTEDEAQRQAARHGWTVGEDSGRGYRRMVASPRPVRIVEMDAISALIEQGQVVIAAGGGGVPVIEDAAGWFRGVEAVIDKDLVAQRLATTLGADALVLITDVTRVMLDYGTPTARSLGETTVEEMLRHAEDGQFAEGSMGPKVRAAVGFVRDGGRISVITNAELACASLEPGAEPDEAAAGTRIVADRSDVPPEQRRTAEPPLGAAP